MEEGVYKIGGMAPQLGQLAQVFEALQRAPGSLFWMVMALESLTLLVKANDFLWNFKKNKHHIEIKDGCIFDGEVQ